MGWPTDGLPRYKVVRTDGMLEMPHGMRSDSASRVKWQATFAVLDRAFCHREVAHFRSENFGGTSGPLAIALARTEAHAVSVADELNGVRKAA